jgi:hypothetical protein
MTDISPQPWAAPDLPSGPADGRAPILLAVSERTAQRRLTVLLRAILAIPHLVVLWLLGIVAEVIAVIGWFGALFTGRLPQFAEDYLSGYLHWYVRVYAYYALLTDAYPPFAFGDTDYPVRVAIPPRGPLNRLAVLFRIFLAIPAAVVGGLLVWGGWTIVLFIAWLIMLVTGTMPESLYQAYAAVLRYYTRYFGYLLLLTSEYPSEIFGDRTPPGQFAAGQGVAGYPAAGPEGFPAQPAGEPGAAQADQLREAEPPGYPTEPSGQTGYPTPPSDQTDPTGQTGLPTPPSEQTGYPTPPSDQTGHPAEETGHLGQPAQPAQPPGYPAPPASFAGAVAQPGDTAPFAGTAARPAWPLVLSDGARKLVGLFLALGVVFVIGYTVLIIVVVGLAANSTVTRNNAITQVQASYRTLNGTLSTFQAKSTACGPNLQCVTAVDRQAGQAFAAFGTSVGHTDMPDTATTKAASQLASASLAAGHLFQRLGSATSVAQYEAIVSSSNIQQVVGQVGLDYQNLGNQLNSP